MLEASQHPFYQSEKSVSQKDGRHDGDAPAMIKPAMAKPEGMESIEIP